MSKPWTLVTVWMDDGTIWNFDLRRLIMLKAEAVTPPE